MVDVSDDGDVPNTVGLPTQLSYGIDVYLCCHDLKGVLEAKVVEKKGVVVFSECC